MLMYAVLFRQRIFVSFKRWKINTLVYVIFDDARFHPLFGRTDIYRVRFTE